MVAGGVDDQLIKAATDFYAIHSTTLMREVSAVTSGPTDLGSGRDDVIREWELTDPRDPTTLAPVDYVLVKGRWSMYAKNDRHFLNNLHSDLRRHFDDPAGKAVLPHHLWRVKPETVSTETLAELVDDFKTIRSKYGPEIIDEFLSVGNRHPTTLLPSEGRTISRQESGRAMINSLAYRNPHIGEQLEIFIPANGDVTLEHIYEALDSVPIRPGTMTERELKRLAAERPAMERVIDRLATMTNE
jgi:hypothetical protein